MHSRRLPENAHLLRYLHPSSLRRTSRYASLLGISEALHLGIFSQPPQIKVVGQPYHIGLFRITVSCRSWVFIFPYRNSANRPARETRHNFDISPVQATASADLSLDIFSLLR